MPTDVTMPKLTDSMEEGRIVGWKVAVGDQVNEGDVLAEIETDKAVMELESFWAGAVVELIRGDGAVVAVGEIIARIGPAGEVAEQPLPAVDGNDLPATPQAEDVATGETEPGEPEVKASPDGEPEIQEPQDQAPGDAGVERPVEEPAVQEPGEDIPIPGGHPLSERGGVASARPTPPVRPAGPPEKTGVASQPAAGFRAAPRARRRALELGVDLSTVKPTGGDGQVTVEDVESAARGAASAPDATAEPAPVPPDRADEELPPVLFAPEEAEAEDVSFYQKAVIRRVVASKHVIPHFYVTKAVRADALLERQEEARDATGATLTHFIMQACAKALQAYPEANRSYDRGRWIRWKVVHLGLAVQTDAGLVVAVLREAQGRSVSWLAEHTRALVVRARGGKLTGPERSNPTFTISNLGAYDVESFSAIINPPSALTVAVGSVMEVPVVEGGQVVPGKVLHLTLSCDHRVVDGVLAAKFLGEVKRLLESPEEL